MEHLENASIIAAEMELVYRTKVKSKDRPIIQESADTYKLFKKYWNADTIELFEEMKMLFLNKGNRVLGIMEVSSGGITGTVCDIKLIFGAALKAAASKIILCHNHPSGQLKPSKADEMLTEQIHSAGLLLGIPLLDHLIISGEGYYSFAEEGML